MPDATAIRIRRRSPWQATELAWPLVRRTAPTLYTVWLLVVVPVWLLVTLATAGNTLWCLFILWWLRPWFDIPLVRTLGQAVFTPVTPRSVLASLPGALLRSILPAITLDRLDPARASNLPVRQLEQLRGRALLNRYGVLGAQERGVSVAWTLGCWLIEQCLLTATILLLIQLSPGPVQEWLSERLDFVFAEDLTIVHWIVSLLWFSVFIVVEPFYVAGGLSLYLNRRTALEGWDVEIAFHDLARRAKSVVAKRRSRPGGVVATVLVWVAVATFFLGNPPTVMAQPPAGEAARSEASPTGAFDQVDRHIAEILDDPQFGSQESRKSWELRWEIDPEEEAESGELDWLVAIPWMGQLLEILLWCALAAALITLLVVALRAVPTATPELREPASPDGPTNWQVGGLDVRPDSLPTDLLGSARRRLDEGRLTEALSLLYRGALSQLVQTGMEVPDAWTELDCVRGTRELLSDEAHGYLRRLTGIWTRAAYAGIAPTTAEVAQLCADYPSFSAAGAPRPNVLGNGVSA